ncbi:MAG: hypothetical protein ACI37Q_00950 [Candidatus Gastranaerophilaceae bacterium]
MKKFVLPLLLISSFIFPLAVNAVPYNYLEAPNGSNRNFTGLMQRQFEKEETLDFIDNPEDYKTKREQKDVYLDYQEGKIPYPATRNIIPAANQMEFTTDENGQIKIQGIR